MVESSGPLPEVAALPNPLPVVEGSGEGAAAEPEPEPVIRSVPKLATTQLGTAGGELTAGTYRVTIPGLSEALEEVTFAPLLPTDLVEPGPISQVLAAADLQPRYTVTEGMMQLRFPLDPPQEPGTDVQLLTFNRSMDAFFVVDETRVSSDGTVTFRTNMFSQYAVIAAPQLAATSDCEGDSLALRQQIPNRSELNVVGRVERDRRMPRSTAFSVLADLRFFPGAERILFKNEERRLDRNPNDVVYDEDFLVDPRLAGPTIELGRLVQERWIDPVSGGPAFQLRITDAYDSMIEHSSTSNHYRGLAVDLTLSPVPAANLERRREYYGVLGRLSVCAGYDFVHFENRHHIHASSRPTRVAFVEETESGGTRIIVSDLDGTDRVDLSAQTGFPCGSHSITGLAFSEDGRFLDVVTEDEGATRSGFRLPVDGNRYQTLEELPELAQSDLMLVDPSLELHNPEGRIAFSRPAEASLMIEGQDPPPRAEFALTSETTRGTLPTVWSAQ
ncbi:MAG: hypothetical protein KC561_02690 [Myxococcales bacterium]|nr:hypothetical protein [Myxococcales bacterium]